MKKYHHVKNVRFENQYLLLKTYATHRPRASWRCACHRSRSLRRWKRIPSDGDTARRKAGVHLASFVETFASIGVQLGARYDGSPLVHR